jgi:hypothetical protein
MSHPASLMHFVSNRHHFLTLAFFSVAASRAQEGKDAGKQPLCANP